MNNLKFKILGLISFIFTIFSLSFLLITYITNLPIIIFNVSIILSIISILIFLTIIFIFVFYVLPKNSQKYSNKIYKKTMDNFAKFSSNNNLENNGFNSQNKQFENDVKTNMNLIQKYLIKYGGNIKKN
ncbi:hypothetical protein NPX79_03515 [Spiroplasma endosymbiont of Anurida maritima]|uniref:hypothetical protein n=1 Tax=Spiroplasma endosymbiont of Anurida maritima TaxID=2967972 RepID=UPI0036D244F9